jgi:PAS domain S-box-containing protein
VTSRTAPNPYLKVPERDITTSSGRKLTLMNPAFMTRQAHELAAKAYGVRGHITSLKPIRPENTPDPWETKALEAIQRGVKEVSSIEMVEGKAYMRLMRSLPTESGCLKCHGEQGYKVGDVRGGISVSLPMEPLLAIYRPHILVVSLGHGMLWLLGLVGLGLGTTRLKQQILEREQAEEALRESYTILHAVIEATPDAIFVKDLQGCYSMVNSACASHLGRSVEEVIDKDDTALLSPDSARHLMEVDRRIMASGEAETFEEAVTILGKTRMYLTTKAPYRDNHGNICGIIGVARDITERKRAERALRGSEEFSTSLLNNSPNPVIVINPDTSVRYVNPALEKLTGFSSTDIIGKKIPYPWWTEETLDKTKKDIKKAFRNGALQVQELFKTKDEERFWVEITSGPVASNGEFKYYLANWVDITERKRAEDELRESEATARALLNAPNDLVMLLDTQGVFLDVNEATAHRFSMSVDELTGMYAWDLFESEVAERRKAVVDAVIETGKSFQFEDERQGLYWDTIVYPVLDSERMVTRVAVVVRDITDRRRAEEEIEKLARFPGENPQPVLRVARDGTILYANQAAWPLLNLWGCQVNQLLPEYWYEFTLDVSSSGSSKETEVECGDRVFSLTFAPVAEADYVNIYGLDITERKLSEEQVHESEEKYRQLVSTTTDAIMVFDADTRQFIEVNKACEDLYGYSREEFLKLKHTDITAEPEKSEDSIEKTLRGLVFKISVRYHKKKDGTSFPVEISTSTFVQKGRRVICGVIRDITERKRAEEELLTYQLQLRSLASELSITEERERRRLSTDLHDSIGQFLGISKIKLDALRSGAPWAALAGDLDEVRELIGQAIQQTRSLTYDLSPPALYQFGLEEALESLVERMEELHRMRIDLTDDKKPKPLSEDLAVLLFRSVQELLVNILKHAQTRDARVSIGWDGGEVRIMVADDGIGFDISEIDSHVDRAGKFGLFSIKERLHYLGGRAKIISKPGQGTEVTLVVPLQGDE